MRTIVSEIRLFADVLATSGFLFKDVPEFFRILVKFLESEPEANFYDVKPASPVQKAIRELKDSVPMTLNKEAEEKLEGMLAEKFSDRMQSARAGEPHVNFLYLLGQALVTLAVKLDGLGLMAKEEEDKEKVKSAARIFYGVWGGPKLMGASRLYERFQGKSMADAKKELLADLRKSAEVSERLIAPLAPLDPHHGSA